MLEYWWKIVLKTMLIDQLNICSVFSLEVFSELNQLFVGNGGVWVGTVKNKSVYFLDQNGEKLSFLLKNLTWQNVLIFWVRVTCFDDPT